MSQKTWLIWEISWISFERMSFMIIHPNFNWEKELEYIGHKNLPNGIKLETKRVYTIQMGQTARKGTFNNSSEFSNKISYF